MLIRFMGCLFSLFFLVTSGVVISQELNKGHEKQAIKERIRIGNETFISTVSDNPNDIFTVTFSFNSHKKIEDVIEAAELHGLNITGFRHREGEHSGGVAVTHFL